MSVDVDATIVIGWILEDSKVDQDVFEMWNDNEKTDEIRAIIGDDYASDWVGYTNNYSCDEVYIGFTPRLITCENGSPRALSIQEICDQLTSAETAAKAKRVYEAICGEPPKTEPQFELFARWW